MNTLKKNLLKYGWIITQKTSQMQTQHEIFSILKPKHTKKNTRGWKKKCENNSYFFVLNSNCKIEGEMKMYFYVGSLEKIEKEAMFGLKHLCQNTKKNVRDFSSNFLVHIEFAHCVQFVKFFSIHKIHVKFTHTQHTLLRRS